MSHERFYSSFSETARENVPQTILLRNKSYDRIFLMLDTLQNLQVEEFGTEALEDELQGQEEGVRPPDSVNMIERLCDAFSRPVPGDPYYLSVEIDEKGAEFISQKLYQKMLFESESGIPTHETQLDFDEFNKRYQEVSGRVTEAYKEYVFSYLPDSRLTELEGFERKIIHKNYPVSLPRGTAFMIMDVLECLRSAEDKKIESGELTVQEKYRDTYFAHEESNLNVLFKDLQESSQNPIPDEIEIPVNGAQLASLGKVVNEGLKGDLFEFFNRKASPFQLGYDLEILYDEYKESSSLRTRSLGSVIQILKEDL